MRYTRASFVLVSTRRALLTTVFLACLGVCGTARAQETEAPPASEVGLQELPAAEPEPFWKKIAPVPIVFYTPETQLGFGAGLMATWRMPGAWQDRPSNVIGYGIYTTRRQILSGASYELRFADDRWVWMQDFRFIDWPDRFYGIGNDTKVRDRENYTDHYAQLESELFYRAVSRLYLGLRHHLRMSRARDLEEGGTLYNERPLGVGNVAWSGVGTVLLWDTRSGLFWPEHGSLLRADATHYRPGFGADFSADLLRLDLRHYQPLWRDHVLALRFLASGIVGDAPIQLLPALGGANLFRGWFMGRLRDRVMAAVELEYRVPLSLRWSLVGFGSVGRVAQSVSAFKLQGLRAAGGGGVRFAVRKDGRANFRLDVAYGDDMNVYFQFREAF